MIHIRIDHEQLNSNQQMACGLRGKLPDGDKYFFEGEALVDVKADCPGCNPTPRQLGTPLSQLSGRPGWPGYEQFEEIAKSWGYE